MIRVTRTKIDVGSVCWLREERIQTKVDDCDEILEERSRLESQSLGTIT
jgi:hypothetical protein